jgi:hypothetical protein
MVASSKTGRKKSEENIVVEKPAVVVEPESLTNPAYVWPEWQDSDVNAEKWASKVAFEDPDTPLFNYILGNGIVGWKRVQEFMLDGAQPCVCSPSSSGATYLQRESKTDL